MFLCTGRIELLRECSFLSLLKKKIYLEIMTFFPILVMTSQSNFFQSNPVIFVMTSRLVSQI